MTSSLLPASHVATVSAFVVLAALAPSGALGEAPSPVPKIQTIIPDETGGIWIIGQDGRDRSWMRFCASSDPGRCGPWSAMDLGWGQRIERPVATGAFDGFGFEKRIR